ncbi:MAG: hypothetical protein WBE18_03230 [Gammaproteobacteria bacterium]
MRTGFPKAIGSFIVEIAKLYHDSRVRAESRQAVRYRIVTTLDEYKKSKMIELALTDRPGDILSPMSIQQIKVAGDIVPNMHPVDVNSINDLYYLSKDKVIEVKISGEKIIAVTHEGLVTEYDINEQVNLDKIVSTRVSYLIGHMQAEKLMREAYKENNRYKITKDNIATLHVTDNKTNKQFLKKPIDILFSEEYKFYSKEDVAKIGYICGQMTHLN